MRGGPIVTSGCYIIGRFTGGVCRSDGAGRMITADFLASELYIRRCLVEILAALVYVNKVFPVGVLAHPYQI